MRSRMATKMKMATKSDDVVMLIQECLTTGGIGRNATSRKLKGGLNPRVYKNGTN